MRVVLILIWTIVLFLFTCTTSLEQLFEQRQIQFHWTASPSFNELFAALPTELNPHFIIRKMGHALSFFILTILLLTRISSKMAFALSLLYAALTEVLQLYFHRDGRIFDIGFDSVGIMIAVLIVEIPRIFLLIEARLKKIFLG